MKITIEKITKNFGRTAALQDVSFQVEDGEFFFILGPSGCGKTTLLRAVAGFVQADSGRILFDDRLVNDLPPYRRNTGMVFQNYALWPHLTVAQNVAFGLTVPGRNLPPKEREARVADALALVHLEDYAGRRPGQLSGGQQQRVALARALVIKPDCLLLDEPLSNLDAKLRREMRVELKRIVRETGLTALYVTHDQKEALSMADRCAVLNLGRVEQVGPPQELYRRPASLFTADFIGATNLVPGRVTQAGGGHLTVETAAGTWSGPNPSGRFQAGDRVTLSIRPEAIHFSAPPAGTVNRQRARLVESVYLGESIEYLLEPAAGIQLRACRLNPENSGAAAGSQLDFWVDPAEVVVLAGTAA